MKNFIFLIDELIPELEKRNTIKQEISSRELPEELYIKMTWDLINHFEDADFTNPEIGFAILLTGHLHEDLCKSFLPKYTLDVSRSDIDTQIERIKKDITEKKEQLEKKLAS